MAELEIGIFKSGRRAYGFDDIAIVPSRRTRDPEDVDISWEIDAYRFELPLMASAMDGVVSPATAIEIGRLGGLGVLNLEGLWTRYEDPTNLFDEIRELPTEKATARMQQMYAEPVKMGLVTERIKEMSAAGVTTAASVTPQKTELFAPALLAAELDLLVIQGTVVSAEHVSKTVEPLNLKRFIREFEIPVIVGGCASYQAGLHLMRTGAVGVLVGVGPGNACTTRGVLGIGVPQATAIADVAHARSTHMLETGEYAQVIASFRPFSRSRPPNRPLMWPRSARLCVGWSRSDCRLITAGRCSRTPARWLSSSDAETSSMYLWPSPRNMSSRMPTTSVRKPTIAAVSRTVSPWAICDVDSSSSSVARPRRLQADRNA